MSATILRFPVEPPVDRSMPIAVAQRSFLAVEDALAGEWSDSILIALLATASPAERAEILQLLEQRGVRR